MNVTVFDSAALCKRWGVAPNSIRKMEAEGKLHRLPDLPGVKYSAAEVYQLESIGPAAKGLTAWERKQKDDEIASLKEEVQELRKRLGNVIRVVQGGRP